MHTDASARKKISIFTYLFVTQLSLVVFCTSSVGIYAYLQGVRQLDREMAVRGTTGVDISAGRIQHEKVTLLIRIGLIVLISGLLASLASLLASRRLAQVFKILNRKLEVVASSKADLTQRLNTGTFLREISLLEESINQVQDNNRYTLKSIAKITGFLNAISRKLVTSSHTVSAGSEEVSATMAEINSGAQIQSSSTSHIASMIQEISAGLTEAADSAAEARQVSVNSTRAAENGQITVKETLDLLVRIEHFAGKLKDLSNDLNERSEQIRRVLDILTHMSRQTKILALNANIEAAKAGEAGRGFAVVAQQIRELAETSQNSVDNIAERITEVRSALSETVSLVGGFYELVEMGGSKIMEAETRLIEIQEISKENLSFVNRMSDLVGRQAGQTKATANLVQTIAEISEKFAVSSQSVTQAAEAQAGVMQEILDAAENIQLTVDELQKMVEECKVD
jgi:methyl-accepting chemotaxis protein